MKAASIPLTALLLCAASAVPVSAAIEVRLSVKFILSSTGARPVFPGQANTIDVSTSTTFAAEVDYGNQVLVSTGSGYRLRVVEFIDIQPAAPAGQPANYWYNLNARDFRAVIEAAALANQGSWRWNTNSLNIFVNNTSSGSCSFVGTGSSISLGATLFTQGTVVHEIGHFMNLSHTHFGDPDCSNFTPDQPLANYLTDGDLLASTVRDHPCFTQNQLSIANFGSPYAALSPQQQAAIDTTLLNVMSYHTEARLLPDQMDIWADTANGPRQTWVSGRTVFVDRNSTCISIDDLSADYRWWVDRNPPQGIAHGSSKGVGMHIEPPAPAPPPQWPPPGWSSDWPPNFELPRPPAPWYPSNWAWPPAAPAPIDVCFGGPRKSFSDGLGQATAGDVVMVRAGTYNEPQLITKQVTLGSTRGTVVIGR